MSPDSRLKKAWASIRSQGLDGLLVSVASNISYLTRYTSRDSYLLLSPKENIYFTDSRYTQEATLSLKSKASVKQVNGSLFKSIALSCKELGLSRVGFEERHLAFAEYQKIRSLLDAKIKLEGIFNIIENLRQVKEPDEIKKIREALRITGKAYEFIQPHLVPGVKEIEVVAELERFIRYEGAKGTAFDIIVGSGPNSSFPHHISSQRQLKEHEPVLIDMGVDVEGYKCDLTRVFFLGKIKGLVQKIYDVVKRAQEKAIVKARPGARIAELDQAARGYIARQGYGDFFGHNLGHGVGMDVHEAPHISAKEEQSLEQGMVFTIEPGVYLPGRFGIRVEDMVLVTKDKCEVLSGFVNK
jgi:Xaa-Pro aminopeptidase